MARRNHPRHTRKIMKKVCQQCHGTGRIANWAYGRTAQGQPKDARCETCGGKGWVAP